MQSFGHDENNVDGLADQMANLSRVSPTLITLSSLIHALVELFPF